MEVSGVQLIMENDNLGSDWSSKSVSHCVQVSRNMEVYKNVWDMYWSSIFFDIIYILSTTQLAVVCMNKLLYSKAWYMLPKCQPNNNKKQSNRKQIHTSWWTKGSFTMPPFPTCNDIQVINSEFKSSSFFLFLFSYEAIIGFPMEYKKRLRLTMCYKIGTSCHCCRHQIKSAHMLILDFFLFFPLSVFLLDDLPIEVTTRFKSRKFIHSYLISASLKLGFH